MAIYPDSNVYLNWVEGELPASSVLLSPCVIGPRIDVYEQEAVDGTYTADSDATAWLEFSLPNFDPQYHKPVDYSFLNECNQTWISQLEALYIQDNIDGVVYTVDSGYYLFDYGQGIVQVHPDITYDIGSFSGTIGEAYATNVDGTAAVAGTIEVDTGSTFPYLTVNGNQTRVRSGDIIEIPYVFTDKFTNDAGLAHRIYDNTWEDKHATVTQITGINESANTVTFNADVGDAGKDVCVACYDQSNSRVLYVFGTVNAGDQAQIDNARIGGDESLVQSFATASFPMSFDLIHVYYIPASDAVQTAPTYRITWQTNRAPSESPNDNACIVGDLLQVFYIRTVAIATTTTYASYQALRYVRYGTVTSHNQAGLQTDYILRGTGGDISSLTSDDKIVAVAYASAWVLNSGTSAQLYRRVESNEAFCDGGNKPDVGHFFYALFSTASEEFTDTSTVPLALYGQGANYLCSACESGEIYMWGFLTGDVPDTPAQPTILSVDISISGQNPSTAYIPQYSAIYVLNYGFYDISPLQYTDGAITSTNNNELAFYIITSDGVMALPPAEVNYEFTYNIYRPLSGTPKVTYMAFNSYQPSEPIEITKYADISSNLGNIHPYNPLAYAAYLMYQNRTNNTNTITFFAIPIDSQDTTGYSNAVDVLRAYKNESNVVLYELAALTFSSTVHALMQGFVNERSTPKWSDYRRYWKAICPLPSYISKVTLSSYQIGAADNILQDLNQDFYSLNVQAGDYVEAIPSTMYKTLANSSVTISANAAGFILSHADLATESNITGKYIYFTDSDGTTWTGEITRKLTSTSIWIELDSSPDSIISETGINVYVFRYWSKFRVTSLDSKVSLTVDGNLPASPLIYRLYSQYSKEDIAEDWYAQAKQDDSERVMIVNPWIHTTWENTTYVLPGFYLAAAKAAQAAAKENMSEPMSGWPLQGIDYVEYSDEFFGPDLFQEIYQNGIDIHMNESPNGPVISWRQRTTAQDITIQGKHEQSVVKVVDYLAHIFKNSVEPLTKKYNISTKVAEHINVALQTIINNAKTGPNAIIEASSRLVSIIPIKQPSDLPASFTMASDIPFETGYYIKTFIVHKSPVYRIQHEMFISQTEEEA